MASILARRAPVPATTSEVLTSSSRSTPALLPAAGAGRLLTRQVRVCCPVRSGCAAGVAVRVDLAVLGRARGRGVLRGAHAAARLIRAVLVRLAGSQPVLPADHQEGHRSARRGQAEREEPAQTPVLRGRLGIQLAGGPGERVGYLRREPLLYQDPGALQ